MTVLARAIDPPEKHEILRVGPNRTIKTIADSAALARAGAIVHVDAGDYRADVAVWQKDNITIRAVGGRVRLLARGAAAESKAIWVVRAKGMRVEGFDFVGARVADKNGAGIRLERGTLSVQDCSFTDNENGILTSNDPQVELEVVNSEFGYNGYGDGQSHNLYAGTIARLSVTGSYFHHARVGHLLKSRAAENHIVNNRLIDGEDGTASYELEFPNGGVANVVGNTIGQSTRTENLQLISFGAEGYKWPRNTLHLANNNMANPLRNGVLLKVAPGADAVQVMNNVVVGYGSLPTGSGSPWPAASR
jgi:hypothetical protein